MTKYTVIIEKAGKNYSAYSPDVPGCVATGATIEKTIKEMAEAIRLHIELMKERHMEIPKPETWVTSVEVSE